jgi:hypothetical protein
MVTGSPFFRTWPLSKSAFTLLNSNFDPVVSLIIAAEVAR